MKTNMVKTGIESYQPTMKFRVVYKIYYKVQLVKTNPVLCLECHEIKSKKAEHKSNFLGRNKQNKTKQKKKKKIGRRRKQTEIKSCY